MTDVAERVAESTMTMSSSGSSELLSAARAGRPEALGELLHLYANYLTILSASQLDEKLRGRVSPSDVVQETYAEAARDFGHFRGSTAREFAAWLRQILIQNLARAVERHVLAAKRDVRREMSIDHIRQSVHRSSRRLENLLAAPGETPSGTLEQQQRALAVADALTRLPASYREVVLLRNFQGLSFKEVAATMQRSEGAVRMLWLRALQELRSIMRDSE